MALVDFAPAHHVASSPVAGFLRTAANWFAARRSRYAQDAALQSLLFAPEHRLRDLGISRDELIQAMAIHRK